MLSPHEGSHDAESGLSIAGGATVFDAAGEKIGTVREVRPQEGCVVVRQRRLFPEDIDVPLRVIGRIGDDGVYLDLYKEEVLNRDWGAPPVSEARPDAEELPSPAKSAPGAPLFGRAPSAPGDPVTQDHGDDRFAQPFADDEPGMSADEGAADGEKGLYKDALPVRPDPECAVDGEEPRLPGAKA